MKTFRKYRVVLVVLLYLVALGSLLWSCSADNKTSDPAPRHNRNSEGLEYMTGHSIAEKVTLYRGRDLHCAIQDEDSQAGWGTCDFVRFYAENPDFLPRQR